MNLNREARVTQIVDQAHQENWGGKHRSGFCEACADAYLVAQRTATDHRESAARTWLASDEAFEIAYRGARSCGVGKMSPAQLTASLNALVNHLEGEGS